MIVRKRDEDGKYIWIEKKEKKAKKAKEPKAKSPAEEPKKSK